MTCDQQQMFGPNSEPHGWTVLEVLTRDLYGALKSRTTVRSKDDFVDLSIEEYVGNQGRAKRTDVRLHTSAVEAMRAILAAQPVSATPDAQQIEPASASDVALLPYEPAALAASVAECEAMSLDDDYQGRLTVSEAESIAAVLHELKRLQRRGALPVALGDARAVTFDGWWETLSHQQKAAIGDWRDAAKGWDAAARALALQTALHVDDIAQSAFDRGLSAGNQQSVAQQIGIQEAWEAAGGNPGVKATREELLEALKQLDEVCDEVADASLNLEAVRIQDYAEQNMLTLGEAADELRADGTRPDCVAPLATTHGCTMGVGCDEAGACYAMAHGQPDRCAAAAAQSTDTVTREQVEQWAKAAPIADFAQLTELGYERLATFAILARQALLDAHAPHAMEIGALHAEVGRLNAIINTPQSGDFLRAVSIEAEHQRQRWGHTDRAGKTPADWFWLVGYLAGKALTSHNGGDIEKAEHHVITTAAALENWHRYIFGKTDMRPGIDGEAALGQRDAAKGDRA